MTLEELEAGLLALQARIDELEERQTSFMFLLLTQGIGGIRKWLRSQDLTENEVDQLMEKADKLAKEKEKQELVKDPKGAKP